MVDINGYTTAELCRATGLSRQRIHQIARARKWTPRKVGTVNVWTEMDVPHWLDAWQRTQLLIKAGWWGANYRNGQDYGLCEDDAIDAECPQCGGSAVVKPGEMDQIYCEKCGLTAA